jgi:hypothetical protein
MKIEDLNFLFDYRIEKFTMVGVEVKGLLVCDKNGLPLASNYLFSKYFS